MNPYRSSFAVAALALILAASGCAREAAGDYPASNGNNCLPDVSLIDQHGNPISLASLKGKPVLIDFIYTSCASTCPVLTSKIAAVARELGPVLGANVTIVSITLDPEHDRPAQLAAYAKSQAVESNSWLFLTGKSADIDQVLAAFKLRRMRESDGSIMHSVSAFLLGPDGHQIRQYNALDVNAKTVAADIDRLATASK